MENSNGVPALAGWHDDPEDPNFIRYSNGRSWTGQRVAKDRTLTLKNDNVYRPGGGVGRMPTKAETAEAPAPEPAVYQPMTRRERRQLEDAGTPSLEPVSGMFEEDFEFHSAPRTVSYAPEKAEPVVPEKVVHAGFDLSDMDPVELEAPSTVEVSFFDTEDDDLDEDESVPFATQKPLTVEDDEEDDETALPSLDFEGFSGGFVPPVADDEDGEDSGLPSLGESNGSDEELPSLFTSNEDVDESDDLAAPDDDEFFVVKSSSEPAAEEDEDEDEFASALVQRHSYEAPPAPPVKEAEEDQDVAVENDDDEETPDATPAAVFAPVTPVTADVGEDDAEEEDAPFEVIVKSSEDTAPVKDEVVSDDEADDEPEFGFTSKLSRSFEGDEVKDESPSVEKESSSEEKAVVAPKDETVVAPVAVDESDEDDADHDIDPEKPSGLGGKFKSLFGKGRSKQPVLDYEYEGDDEEDEADDAVVTESPSKPEAEPVLKSVAALVEKPLEKPADKPVEKLAEAEALDDEDEEPQLKAGLFSSRQNKEDAAVEVELIDRLKDLAARVASLKTEEKEILARVETAKEQEAKLTQLILQAHEEHELLDQLAKARHKEIEGTHAAKEEDNFLDFLDSHTHPEVEKVAAEVTPVSEAESTVALPVVSQPDTEDAEEEPSDRLPALKLN